MLGGFVYLPEKGLQFNSVFSRSKCKEHITVTCRSRFSAIKFLKSLLQIPGVEIFRENLLGVLTKKTDCNMVNIFNNIVMEHNIFIRYFLVIEA